MGLDAVEMIMDVEEIFRVDLSDGVASEMTTPAMLIAHVQKAVGARSEGKWTDEEIRETIREVISVRSGLPKFSDDDEFVRDLGMG